MKNWLLLLVMQDLERLIPTSYHMVARATWQIFYEFLTFFDFVKYDKQVKYLPVLN